MHASLGVFDFFAAELVHAFDDAFFASFGHWWVVVVVVFAHQIVHALFAFAVHLLDAFENNHDDFVVVSGVIGTNSWERDGIQQTVSILVLQAFAIERCSPGGTTDQEPFGSHIGGGPNQVTDSLEAKHAVVDEERNHVDAVFAVRSTSGVERTHRTGFADAFF